MRKIEQQTDRYPYAIIYYGAPYGLDESGHVVSRHKSREAAQRRFDRESRDSEGNPTTFPLNHRIRGPGGSATDVALQEQS